VAQVVECKHEALSSIFSTTKNKKYIKWAWWLIPVILATEEAEIRGWRYGSSGRALAL
jgi:hypothetical protein